jgi:hypothetical protein
MHESGAGTFETYGPALKMSVHRSSGWTGSSQQTVKTVLLTHFGLQPYRHNKAGHLAFATPNVVWVQADPCLSECKPSS